MSVYFFKWTPQMPLQWPLAGDLSHAQVARFITGINCVGIWDELFFINTVYAVLRSLYPARAANLAQAVVYTSVLYDMAFVGWDPRSCSSSHSSKGSCTSARAPSCTCSSCT